MKKQIIILEVQLEKPVEHLADKIAGRVYTIDGIDTKQDVKVLTRQQYLSIDTKPSWASELYSVAKKVICGN